MITSSVSGEGKTFCSLNIATVFALSEKKTIILGLDLRKPKIFDDFNIKNEFGLNPLLACCPNCDNVSLYCGKIPTTIRDMANKEEAS